MLEYATIHLHQTLSIQKNNKLYHLFLNDCGGVTLAKKKQRCYTIQHHSRPTGGRYAT